MTGAARRWAPLAAGVVLAGVGLGAMGLDTQDLSISVSPPPDPSREEVDPLHLPRDEVATIQGDVQDLGKGLGTRL